MNTLDEAIERAKREVSNPSGNWYMLCLAFVRTCWGIAPTGIPDADRAWELAKHKRTTGTPPKGTPVYWAVGRYGHIALSAGGGKVYSNDIRRHGQIDLVSMSEFASRWGARYRGWSTDYCGTALPLTTNEEKDWFDMASKADLRDVVNDVVDSRVRDIVKDVLKSNVGELVWSHPVPAVDDTYESEAPAAATHLRFGRHHAREARSLGIRCVESLKTLYAKFDQLAKDVRGVLGK